MTDDDWLEQNADKRTRCEIWTRVMGYYRETAAFNIGKQAEAAERRHFEESRANLAAGQS